MKRGWTQDISQVVYRGNIPNHRKRDRPQEKISVMKLEIGNWFYLVTAGNRGNQLNQSPIFSHLIGIFQWENYVLHGLHLFYTLLQLHFESGNRQVYL